MKIDQENGIQARNYVARVKHLIDPDFDSLRARVWERSAREVERRRMQEIAMTVVAIVLGSVAGWVVVR